MAEDTIFHKIIKREIPADIVYEDDKSIAFKDVNPAGPTHVLVVPKQTMPSLRNAVEEDKELLGHLLLVCTEIARLQGIDDDGYRVVINTGENGGQTVFQLHMHVLGGREFDWPPG